MDKDAGRGPIAVADMKARIAALRQQGADVIDVLWERHRQAVLGGGFRYEYAPSRDSSGTRGVETVRRASGLQQPEDT